MNLIFVAMLIAATQFFSTPIHGFYQGPRPNLHSPLSGSVLVAQQIRSGRIRIPHSAYQQPFTIFNICSPAPCTLANVQASEGGSPVNETPIAVNPNHSNRLLTGGNDYNCPSIQGFYATRDGGSTWNHTCMKTLAGTGGDGDPGVAYDTNDVAYITGIDSPGSTSVIAFEKSMDNGATWTSPAVAVNGISPYTFVDKEWIQIDDTPTSPRKDAIYISTTEFDPSSNSLIAVAHSTNGGASWTNVGIDAVVYPVVDQFSDLAVGADGTVYLTWMRCSATGPTGDCGGTRSQLMFSKSSDGGTKWTTPVVMANANLAPDSCGAFYGCLPNTSERVSNIPAIDADRSGRRFNGRLYTAFYNWTGNRLQLAVVRSKDGGATWSKHFFPAGSAKNDEFFPWLTTDSHGVVGVTWLDRRLDNSNVSYDAFATTSSDGGLTYATNVRISTVSSNPFNDGFGSGFMGDYTGNIWTRNTLYASWTDTRSGVGQDETGGYRVR